VRYSDTHMRRSLGEWKLEKEAGSWESAEAVDVGDLLWLDFERMAPSMSARQGLSFRSDGRTHSILSGITAGEHLARAMAYIIWLSTPITILLLHSHG